MTSNKKGIIILGSPRSGSHMTCDMLFNDSTVENKINIGEICNIPQYTNICDNLLNYQILPVLFDKLSNNTGNKFIFCSLVQYWAKNLLAVDLSILDNYQIFNIRRRNKIDQYISWCVLRAQLTASITKHTTKFEDYQYLLPWESTLKDLEQFIAEQNLDFAFMSVFSRILYYEDLVNSNLKTSLKKNVYPIPHEEIVTDYKLVKNILGKYNYHGR